MRAAEPGRSDAFTVRAALTAAADEFHTVGIPDPETDAELLLGHLLDLSRGEVRAASIRGDVLPAGLRTTWDEAVTRRVTREPLQHITGRAPFRHLLLRVGPGVFVPRPETESVAQFAVDALRATANPEPIGVDLGTGSGAIALAMATEVPHARVFAVEKSPAALEWAARNAAEIGVANLTLHHGDLAEAFGELDGRVDVVVSNPPYVPDDAVPRDPEVRDHDPHSALFGGPDGLDVVRTVSQVAKRLTRSGGLVVIEHGEWQGESVRAILADDGWEALATHPDLTMRDRTTTGVRP